MAIIQTEVPYTSYSDPTTDEPLSFAFLFFGIVDQDPEQNPIQVQYKDQGGALVDIDQPIRTTSGGTPEFQGSPVQLFIDGDYSQRVQNQYRVTVFDSPDSNDSNADTLRASLNLSDVSDVDASVANLGLTGALLADNNLDDLSNAVTARDNLGLSDALLGANNLSDVADAAASRANLGISDGAAGLIFVGKAIVSSGIVANVATFNVFLPANGEFYYGVDSNAYSKDRTTQGNDTWTLTVGVTQIDSVIVSKQGDAEAHRDFAYVSPNLAGSLANAAGATNVQVQLTAPFDGNYIFDLREVYLTVSAAPT